MPDSAPLLSLIVWLPALGALACLCLPATHAAWAKRIALGTWVIEALLLVPLFYRPVHRSKGLFNWLEHYEWFQLKLGEDFGYLHVDYLLGVDGLNLLLLALSVLLFLVAGWLCPSTMPRPRAFYSLYLLLGCSVMGAFCSLDLLLFFLFFELMAFPTYLLIAHWGSQPRAAPAALQFLLYTLTGSVLLLFVLISLYLSVSIPSPIDSLSAGIPPQALIHRLDLSLLSTASTFGGPLATASGLRYGCFLALLIGLGIKLPIVPLHGWLPKAHVEASTSLSIILAGILLKLGGYGFIRIALGAFADQVQAHASLLAGLGLASLLYGALLALAQDDFKRLVAYSSVAHMGFVLLGMASLTPQGLLGAYYQLISHGLLSAALFMLAGYIEQHLGTRKLSALGGLAPQLPRLATLALVACLASFGLPGFAGFVSEFLVLSGWVQAYGSHLFSHFSSGGIFFGTLGGMLVLTACFIWTYQRIFHGPFLLPPTRSTPSIPPTPRDLTGKSFFLLSLLLLLCLVLGLYPQPFLNLIEAPLHALGNGLGAY